MRCIGGCRAELENGAARREGWGALDRDAGLCPHCAGRHGFAIRKPLAARALRHGAPAVSRAKAIA